MKKEWQRQVVGMRGNRRRIPQNAEPAFLTTQPSVRAYGRYASKTRRQPAASVRPPPAQLNQRPGGSNQRGGEPAGARRWQQSIPYGGRKRR